MLYKRGKLTAMRKTGRIIFSLAGPAVALPMLDTVLDQRPWIRSMLAVLLAMLESPPVAPQSSPPAERYRCSYPGNAPDDRFPIAQGDAGRSPMPAPAQSRNRAGLAE